MTLRKLINKQLGEYYTYDVNDVYEAIYVAKFPRKAVLVDKGIITSTKCQTYKVQVNKTDLLSTLEKQKVQVLKNNTPLKEGYSYIKHHNGKWRPIFFKKDLMKKIDGGKTRDGFKSAAFRIIAEQDKAEQDKAEQYKAKQAEEETPPQSPEETAESKIESKETDVEPSINVTLLKIKMKHEKDFKQKYNFLVEHFPYLKKFLSKKLLNSIGKLYNDNNNDSLEDNIIKLVGLTPINTSKNEEIEEEYNLLYNKINNILLNIETGIFKFEDGIEELQNLNTVLGKLQSIESTKQTILLLKEDIISIQSKLKERKTQQQEFDKQQEIKQQEFNKQQEFDKQEFDKQQDLQSNYEKFRNHLSSLKKNILSKTPSPLKKTPSPLKIKLNETINNYDFIATLNNLSNSYDRHGFEALNNILPCYELLESFIKLNKVRNYKKTKKEDPVSQGGSNTGEEALGNAVNQENAVNPENLEDYSEFVELFETEAGSDTDDDDWEPTGADVNQLIEDERDTNSYINDVNSRKSNKRIYIFFSLVVSLIFSLLVSSFNKHYTNAYIFKNSDAIQVEKEIYDLSIVKHNLIKSGSQELVRDKIVETTDYYRRLYYNSILDKQLDIKVTFTESSEYTLFTSNLKLLLKPEKPGQPKCSLIGKAGNVLSTNQQLFVHKAGVFESFIELMHFVVLHQETKQQTFLDDEDLKTLSTNLFSESMLKHLETKKIITFVDFVDKTLLDNVINVFNNFTKTFKSHKDVKLLFDKLEKDTDFIKQPNRFKERMTTLKVTLLEHYINFSKGYDFDSPCTIGNKNNVEINLNYYTQGLLYDLRTGYQNIAKRQIKVYTDFEPIVTDLLTLYKDTLKIKDTITDKKVSNENQLKYDEARLTKINMDLASLIHNDNNNMLDTKKLNEILEILVDKNTFPDIYGRLDTVVTKIYDISPQYAEIIKNLKIQLQYSEMTNSIAVALKLDTDPIYIATSKMFQDVKDFASPIVEHGITKYSPSLLYNLNDVSTFMVKTMNENIITNDDKLSVKYAVGSRIASVIYDIFKIDEVTSLFDSIYNLPFINQLSTIGSFVAHVYDKDTNENYVRICRSSMLMMESKIKTIRGKMNSKVNMNQMMSLMGNIIKDTIESGTDNTVPSAIASMAWNLSNDYIKLQLEIEKLELGQIIFHLQNDIIEKTEIQITPSIFKNDIILTDDIEFFKKYHDKRIYVNKIVQRILRIMSLILMDKEGYK